MPTFRGPWRSLSSSRGLTAAGPLRRRIAAALLAGLILLCCAATSRQILSFSGTSASECNRATRSRSSERAIMPASPFSGTASTTLEPQPEEALSRPRPAPQDASQGGRHSPAEHLLALQKQSRVNLSEWLSAVNQMQPEDLALLGRQCSPTDPCTLAIATAIFMEEPYLEEWIKYNLLIGVEHFFFVHMTSLTLASRSSQNATRALLQPYLSRGVVTMSYQMGIYESPQLLEQVNSMRIALLRYRKFSRWLVNMDPDEFYFSRKWPSLRGLIAHCESLRSPWDA
eukprot:RCo049133